jgi:hypothetical protein
VCENIHATMTADRGRASPDAPVVHSVTPEVLQTWRSAKRVAEDEDEKSLGETIHSPGGTPVFWGAEFVENNAQAVIDARLRAVVRLHA